MKIESVTDDDELLICLDVKFKVKWALQQSLRGSLALPDLHVQ